MLLGCLTVDGIKCEPRWSPAQHFIVKILKIRCPATPAVINVVILCERHGVRRAFNNVEAQESAYFARYGRKLSNTW
jgi:hypothetical protein